MVYMKLQCSLCLGNSEMERKVCVKERNRGFDCFRIRPVFSLA